MENKIGGPISIFDFIKLHKNEHYKIALMEENSNFLEQDIMITPNLDPNEYPDLMLSNLNNHAKVIGKNWYIKFHTK